MHLEHRVDDAPGRFHAVFPIELRDITVHGVTDEALVSAHAIVLLVGNEEFHVFAGDGRSWPLGTDTQADGDPVRTQPEAYIVRALGQGFGEHLLRRTPQLYQHFSGVQGQAFPRADEERHAFPSPGVQVQLHRSVGLDLGARSHIFLGAITPVLAPHQGASRKWPYALEDFHLLIALGFAALTHRRFHGQHRDHLQHMVLYHVTDGADGFVQFPAAADAEPLGHGDLHALDVVAVPDGLDEAVGETEIRQVEHSLLAEIMVYAEDGIFTEQLAECLVECLG